MRYIWDLVSGDTFEFDHSVDVDSDLGPLSEIFGHFSGISHPSVVVQGSTVVTKVHDHIQIWKLRGKNWEKFAFGIIII